MAWRRIMACEIAASRMSEMKPTDDKSSFVVVMTRYHQPHFGHSCQCIAHKVLLHGHGRGFGAHFVPGTKWAPGLKLSHSLDMQLTMDKIS